MEHMDKHENQVDIIEQALFGRSRAMNKARAEKKAAKAAKNKEAQDKLAADEAVKDGLVALSKVLAKGQRSRETSAEKAKEKKAAEVALQEDSSDTETDDGVNRNLFDQMYDKISELVSLSYSDNWWPQCLIFDSVASPILNGEGRHHETVRYDDDPLDQDHGGRSNHRRQALEAWGTHAEHHQRDLNAPTRRIRSQR